MPAPNTSMNEQPTHTIGRRLTAAGPYAINKSENHATHPPRQPLTNSQTMLNMVLAGVSCAIAQTFVQPCETAMVRQQLLARGAVEGQATTFGGMLRQVRG